MAFERNFTHVLFKCIRLWMTWFAGQCHARFLRNQCHDVTSFFSETFIPYTATFSVVNFS